MAKKKSVNQKACDLFVEQVLNHIAELQQREKMCVHDIDTNNKEIALLREKTMLERMDLRLTKRRLKEARKRLLEYERKQSRKK